jgi:hypothetical protein
MHPIAHPEVLARDWLPPIVLGRERELAEVVRRLDPPKPQAPPPWIVGVVGASGSGTSAVARRAARLVVDRLRQARAGVRPRVLAVRTAGVRGSHGVASALLRQLDDGFDGRGFPVAEILAGVMRRVRREDQPVVIVLDDLRVGGPDLRPVLKALASPDRFLPEGEYGMPPTWTILAGTPEGWASVVGSLSDPTIVGRPVGLDVYSDAMLRALADDRASRALGHPAGSAMVDRLVEETVGDGGGARRLIDLLRRQLVGEGSGPGRGGFPERSGPGVVEVETRVVRAIEAAARGREAKVGEVRRCEAALARAQGTKPLPATTLWRRIVRLEHAGYVVRDVRPGGVGGTRSVLRVLTPVDEWVTSARRAETRRGDGPWSARPLPDAGVGAPPGAPTPATARPPFDRAD